jgi:hypothetical protein
LASSSILNTNKKNFFHNVLKGLELFYVYLNLRMT